MMRNLRKINIDHFHVGWYQSTQQGNFISPPVLESQYTYQIAISESVVLIYGQFEIKSSPTDYGNKVEEKSVELSVMERPCLIE